MQINSLKASSTILNLAKNHICFVYFLPLLNIIKDLKVVIKRDDLTE